MLALQQLINARPQNNLGKMCYCFHYYNNNGYCYNKDVKWVCTSYYVTAANPAISSYCQGCIDNCITKGSLVLDEKEIFTIKLFHHL